MSFGSENVRASWESDKVSEPIRILLRNLGVKFNGIIVTCLDRDKAHNQNVGGKSGSKHVPENNPSGKCEAGDFLLQDHQIKPEEILAYCEDHIKEIYVEYHDVGSGLHFHLDCRPPKG